MSKDLKDSRDAGEVKAKLLYLANSYVSSYQPTKNVLLIFINQSLCPYYRKLYSMVKDLNDIKVC